jgi:predicted SprT family Zn-dependent metalloprotease
MEYVSLEMAQQIVKKQYEEAYIKLSLKIKGFIMPVVVWRDMGRRRAGTACYGNNTIELNTNYLKSKDWEKFLYETPLHELAHHISYQLYDETGHKAVWKDVCYKLGLDGNRCHNFSTPEGVHFRKQERIAVSCACEEGHTVSKTIYNRMKKGYRYRCCKCGKTLSFL